MSPLAYWFFKHLMEVGETKDGQGSGDHDTPYRAEQMTTKCHWRFTDLQFLKLMFLRSRVRDGVLAGDTWPAKEKRSDIRT